MNNNQQAGVTLIELLFALIILTVSVLLITSAQNLSVKTTHSSGHARELTRTATNILQRTIADEEQGAADCSDFGSGNSTCTVEVRYCEVNLQESVSDSVVDCSSEHQNADKVAVFVRVTLTRGEQPPVVVQELRSF